MKEDRSDFSNPITEPVATALTNEDIPALTMPAYDRARKSYLERNQDRLPSVNSTNHHHPHFSALREMVQTISEFAETGIDSRRFMNVILSEITNFVTSGPAKQTTSSDRWAHLLARSIAAYEIDDGATVGSDYYVEMLLTKFKAYTEAEFRFPTESIVDEWPLVLMAEFEFGDQFRTINLENVVIISLGTISVLSDNLRFFVDDLNAILRT
jgi:hypothetical protein